MFEAGVYINNETGLYAASALGEYFEFDRASYRCRIEHFSEADDPQGAFRAQQIQGESYVEAGFVHPEALDEYGRMLPELDRSRGENVTYFVATSVDNPADQASVRIIDIPTGGDLRDLAAYRYSDGAIYEEYELFLQDHFKKYGASSIREVAALSKTTSASPLSSYELLREITQQAIRRNSNEIWIMTLAPRAFRSVMASFGPDAIVKIGSEVSVDENDTRTSDELRLSPVIVNPSGGPDSILRAAIAESNPKLKSRLVDSLLFIIDGLNDDEISSDIKEFLGSHGKQQ